MPFVPLGLPPVRRWPLVPFLLVGAPNQQEPEQEEAAQHDSEPPEADSQGDRQDKGDSHTALSDNRFAIANANDRSHAPKESDDQYRPKTQCLFL
jgi:hypothetical protein